MERGGEANVTAGQLGQEAPEQLRKRYFIHEERPAGVCITDNWIELTVRFMADAYGTRIVKDAIRTFSRR